jgi:hypothetical protein
MSQRLDEFNKKVIYTKTNPEDIIAAKKNALFFRKGKEFYFNADGNISGKWEKLPYRTVIIPPPTLTKLIEYEQPYEVWLKTTDGPYDEFNVLLPKKGWQFLAYKDVFAIIQQGKKVNWIFPPPVNTDDPVGNNNSRSYDENYFYAKISGKWYRTPITVFDVAGLPSTDTPYWTTNLPFVDGPRYLPVPNTSIFPGSLYGDQSYDLEFFYIKVSKWKRSRLFMYYNTGKMARF